MSEVSQIHPADCLYPLDLLFCLCQHIQSWYLRKRKKMLISLWRASVVQSVPLSESKIARWSASTHWTERRKNTRLARCAAFVRPALNNDVKLQCSDLSLSSQSHSLLTISFPVHFFQNWTNHFHCYAGISCFKYIHWPVFVISKHFPLYWQQFEHISASLCLEQRVCSSVLCKLWQRMTRFPVNLGLRNKIKLEHFRLEGHLFHIKCLIFL